MTTMILLYGMLLGGILHAIYASYRERRAYRDGYQEGKEEKNG